jgi:hypothetical protein
MLPSAKVKRTSTAHGLPIRLALVGTMAVLACDGGSGATAARPEGGAKDADGEGAAKDAYGAESTQPSACLEGRVELQEAPAWLPNRPLWMDAQSFHLAHLDRELGIMHHVLSRETGRVLSSQSYQVHSPQIDGLDSVAGSPQGDVAFAYRYTSDGTIRQEVLSVSGGDSTTWTAPWQYPRRAWGLGWDGEGFTASLLGSDWATARFSAKGELLADVETFAPSASTSYGYFDTETDSQTGTTVFLGAGSSGVVLVGRRGRDTNLTSPAASWDFEGSSESSFSGEVAVALNGPRALLAWVDVSEGLMVREVSLDTGESTAQWMVPNSGFKNVAAAWAGDRWVIVGQHYTGLVLAEIRDNQIQQRTLLRHEPPCLKTKTCADSSEITWYVRRLTVVADGKSAWAGFVDVGTQRVEGNRTLLNYRIIPLRDECNYRTLASE